MERKVPRNDGTSFMERFVAFRYFPLRDIQKQRLLEKKRRQNVTNRGIIYLLPLIISVFALFVVWFSLRRSILRRERSMWGYMMLSQNDSFAP